MGHFVLTPQIRGSLCTMYVISPQDLGNHINKLPTNLNVLSGLVHNKIFDWVNLNDLRKPALLCTSCITFYLYRHDCNLYLHLYLRRISNLIHLFLMWLFYIGCYQSLSLFWCIFPPFKQFYWSIYTCIYIYITKGVIPKIDIVEISQIQNDKWSWMWSGKT